CIAGRPTKPFMQEALGCSRNGPRPFRLSPQPAGNPATTGSKPEEGNATMKKSLRLGAVALGILSIAEIGAAPAADTPYPTRSVRWVVPSPPAGTTDILARIIGQWLSEHMGQQFVIDNRPGFGNNTGTEIVVRAAPDGYTFLLVNPANAINATLYTK